MTGKLQERWHCMNPQCRREVLIEVEENATREKQVCSCGSPMKKTYKPPVFRYLDFLQLDEPELAPRIQRED